MSVLELKQIDRNYSKEGFYREIKEYTNGKHIGSGQEGECFLGKDNYVYKIFKSHLKENVIPETIITSDQLESIHFVFPDVVYTIDGELVGTLTRYISSSRNVDVKPNAIINFAEELARLTEDGFSTVDFSNNFIYSNGTLYNIDTTNYTFDYSKTTAELMVQNFTAFIQGLRNTLNIVISPENDAALNNLWEKYVDTNILKMAEEKIKSRTLRNQ